MNKILLILQREYLVRVQKRSFVIMTLLGPLLIAAIYSVPVILALRDSKARTIAVIDESGLLKGDFKGDKKLTFKSLSGALPAGKQAVLDEKYYAVLYIPKITVENPSGIKLFSKKGISLEVESAVERSLKREIEGVKLRQAGIDTQVLERIDTRVSIDTKNLTDDDGEQDSSTGAAFIVGFGAAFIIYISIFIYGVQVMRGVIEEKTNRIVEVIISSVKPFQLMVGKITGIALVGLTQFLLWIVLGTAISTVAIGMLRSTAGADQEQLDEALREAPALEQRANGFEKAITAMNTLNVPLLLSTFLFYFLGGYLIYSALFAAVGAAADSETDTQQFMFPITIPLILSFVLAQYVIQNPDGPLAFWLSMIPLTSPIIMMVRIPFNPPAWEIGLSMVLLVLGFLFITWIAARIYRVGILMYGKKVNYRELAKWVFYRA
jgi:ABC-2 type transport system permease protein